LSGSCTSAAAANSGVEKVLTVLMTCPRLTGLLFTCARTEYQLMSANVTPESLSAIHVPPPGSDGESTVRPLMCFFDGGRPMARVNFSSRFIARA
jgi:hypothetical protein